MYKKLPLILLVTVIALTGYLYFNRSQNQPSSLSTENTSGDRPSINLEPPTPEESKSGNEKKIDIVKSDKLTLPNTATVAIVDAAQYSDKIEVRAFVSNVIADGTCTYVFRKGNNTIQKEMPAKADARSTPCLNLVFPASELPEIGVWSLTITYSNKNLTGSAHTTVEVM